MEFTLKADWKPTLEWLENIKRGLDDARPLWVAMLPRIHEFVAYEFSGSNSNNWPQLTPQYKRQKVRQGYPYWIGVRTGTMRKAANEEASISITPKQLNWELNKSGTPTKGRGDQYAQFFHRGTKKMPARPIYKTTVRRVNSLLRKDINNLEGNNRMSFTFKWLEKALGDYRK